MTVPGHSVNPYMWLVWFLAAVLHTSVSLVWKVVGRVGVGAVTWGVSGAHGRAESGLDCIVGHRFRRSGCLGRGGIAETYGNLICTLLYAEMTFSPGYKASNLYGSFAMGMHLTPSYIFWSERCDPSREDE